MNQTTLGAVVAFSGIMLVLIDFAHYFKSFRKLLLFPKGLNVNST